MIDAGHGGYDRGGIPGQRVAEKEMTLDVAQRLKKMLTAAGYRVVMTRDSDVFVPLGTRVAIANSYPNAIFVSVHFNSAKRSGAGGIETYFLQPREPSAGVGYPLLRSGRGAFLESQCATPGLLRFAQNTGSRQCSWSAVFSPTRPKPPWHKRASYRQKLAEEIAAGVRGRNSVASARTTTRVATGESIPLQPYIDQTKVVEI